MVGDVDGRVGVSVGSEFVTVSICAGETHGLELHIVVRLKEDPVLLPALTVFVQV